jgi:AI-2 transport protein TqsA
MVALRRATVVSSRCTCRWNRLFSTANWRLLHGRRLEFPSQAIASTIRLVKDNSLSPTLRFLLCAACTVIILWGIRAASDILGPLLLALLFAYAVVPFLKWLMQRFKFTKSAAIAVTAVAVLAFVLFLLVPLDFTTVRIAEKLPTYEHRLAGLYEQVTTYANAHGFVAPILSVQNVLTPERLRAITRVFLPEAGMLISNGLLISLLGFLFVTEMTENIGVKRGALAENLAYYGSDAATYVAVTAKTGAINALLNLVFLLALGVDTPVLWCFLYFFLNFIPTLGFMVALVPPTFVTLLMFGWHRALLVAGGLILTNLIVDNVVKPIFMKHSIDVSFLELTLSLVVWAFLLGLTGAILAIPLTLGLKKFIAKGLNSEQLATTPSP